MNLEELEIGNLYRLTCDVKNPVIDRRKSNPFLKREVFPKGTHFVCMGDDDLTNLICLHWGSVDGSTIVVGVHQPDGTIRMSKNADNRAWSELVVPNLEKIEIDDWDKMRRTFGRHPMASIVRELWEDGTVSHERLLELMRKHTWGGSRR